jgi:cytochrome c oxidase subunit 2
MSIDPGSIFSPVGPHARAISDLFVITLWICAGIFAAVAGLVGYSLVRYRWREGEADPVQLAGNKRIEIIWTAIPCAIVLVLFGLTVHAMEKSDPPASPGEPDLIVIGHQWWWEIRSPKWGFVAANEIHIPVGQPISVRLETTDVLHEFWVPQLTRKMTTVPRAGNHVWMHAEKAGVYQGVCSEFCGTQHAWMRFEVIAEPPEKFAQWVAHQSKPAVAANTGNGARGHEIFRELTCVNCHAIQGVAEKSTAGPDLTHIASRRFLGAGVIPNTPDNLRRWLVNPQSVKPGVLMPNFQLSQEQLDHLVAYFDTLK